MAFLLYLNDRVIYSTGKTKTKTRVFCCLPVALATFIVGIAYVFFGLVNLYAAIFLSGFELSLDWLGEMFVILHMINAGICLNFAACLPASVTAMFHKRRHRKKLDAFLETCNRLTVESPNSGNASMFDQIKVDESLMDYLPSSIEEWGLTRTDMIPLLKVLVVNERVLSPGVDLKQNRDQVRKAKGLLFKTMMYRPTTASELLCSVANLSMAVVFISVATQILFRWVIWLAAAMGLMEDGGRWKPTSEEIWIIVISTFLFFLFVALTLGPFAAMIQSLRLHKNEGLSGWNYTHARKVRADRLRLVLETLNKFQLMGYTVTDFLLNESQNQEITKELIEGLIDNNKESARDRIRKMRFGSYADSQHLQLPRAHVVSIESSISPKRRPSEKKTTNYPVSEGGTASTRLGFRLGKIRGRPNTAAVNTSSSSSSSNT